MATDFSGTNTEKIDKVVAAVIELRTTMRLCFAIIGIGLPLIVGLLTFLDVQSFSTSAKVDRLSDRMSDQISAIKGEHEKLSQRLDRLEKTGGP
jgi:hypothetical protein